MRLYIVRHGHKANLEPDYDGGFNTPLSERGDQQANHLAEFLETKDLDSLYSSAHLRALQTAEPVQAHTDLDWHVWPLFCEGSRTTWSERHRDDPDVAAARNGFRVDGRPESPDPAAVKEKHGHYYLLSELHERFPSVTLDQPIEWPDAWWIPLEHQTHTEAYSRVDLGCQAMVDRHEEGDTLAVICHGISGEMLLTILMEYPWQAERRISFSHTGIIRLDRLDSGRWRIGYLNYVGHLPTDLRS